MYKLYNVVQNYVEYLTIGMAGRFYLFTHWSFLYNKVVLLKINKKQNITHPPKNNMF